MTTEYNILFYSNKCKTCELFMTHCKNNDVLKHFKLICIEDTVGKLPSALKVVPSILVKGHNGLIEGKQTFEWLKGLIEMKKSMSQDKTKLINNEDKNTEDKTKRNLLDFTIKELTGISDDFAYLKVDNPQPKSFLQYGADKEHAIYTAPEGNKINKRQQEDLINKFNSQRTTDQQQFETKIKQVHDDILKSKLGKK